MPKKTTPTPRSIEYRLLDDLKANPANPKDHAVEMIEASVDRFGYIDGAVIDARTGYIISGHGRTKTLRAIRDRGDSPPDGIRVDDQGRWLVPVQVGWASRNDAEAEPAGRWPANVVLDDSQAAELDAQSGELVGRKPGVMRRGSTSGTSIGGRDAYGTAAPHESFVGYGDSGGASRFFPTFRYEGKAPTSERPRVARAMLRLRDDLTAGQVDLVRNRLAEAGVDVD